MIPGEFILSKEGITLNEGRENKSIKVRNTGTWRIGIASHAHFKGVSKDLAFDRVASLGFRLDIPAGDIVFFEPGEEKTVSLVKF